ncbi:MAG: hypothetical protein K8W52_23265 [Deltaproteobacteria bacterium]|nr:hypothetical protein [Deltaproteobacteria bacterium]
MTALALAACGGDAAPTTADARADVDAAPMASPDAPADAAPGLCEGGVVAFRATGAIEAFIVPPCAAALEISAYGAQGGAAGGYRGGRGALARATVAVAPGDRLTLVVGARGAAATDLAEGGGGTGGGGSFVVDADGAAIAIAGGGGGAWRNSDAGWIGGDGLAGPDGGDSGNNAAALVPGGDGGKAGTGGHTSPFIGGMQAGTGGGGFLGDGVGDSLGSLAEGTPNHPGRGFGNGAWGGEGGTLGRDGGFGGGGAAGATGGGGGGYSGGGGGGWTRSVGVMVHSGGGGSIATGLHATTVGGVREGDGVIEIRAVPAS